MKLAIIPARGGSRRIPRKNIRDFCGKPIIAYPIQAALDSGCFEEVMVSTDDPSIARIAQSAGAQVPFLRSAKTSSDTATTAEVLLEVLNQYQRAAKSWTHICCIYPTAPFVTPALLKQGLTMLTERPGADAVMSIVRFSYPIQRGLWLNDGRVSLIEPKHLLARSQDLKAAYHDAGQFYWLNVPGFLRSKQLMGPGTFGLPLPECQVQDIDTEEDWKLAEMKFQQMQKTALR